MFLGLVRLTPSLSFQEVLRGVRASLVRFLLCPLHPFFFFLSSFVYSHGSGSFLCFTYRGDSSTESGSGRTGGESNRLAMVLLRDAPGEPPSPLGKGKDKLMRLNTLWGLNI